MAARERHRGDPARTRRERDRGHRDPLAQAGRRRSRPTSRCSRSPPTRSTPRSPPRRPAPCWRSRSTRTRPSRSEPCWRSSARRVPRPPAAASPNRQPSRHAPRPSPAADRSSQSRAPEPPAEAGRRGRAADSPSLQRSRPRREHRAAAIRGLGGQDVSGIRHATGPQAGHPARRRPAAVDGHRRRRPDPQAGRARPRPRRPRQARRGRRRRRSTGPGCSRAAPLRQPQRAAQLEPSRCAARPRRCRGCAR